MNIERAQEISNQLKIQEKTYDGNRPMIRLALHRVIAGDGSGGFSWSEIRGWVNTLPNAFSNFDICFTVISEDEISNNTFFNLNSFSGSNWENLISTNRVDNALNICFVEGANAGGRASGFLFNSVTSFPTASVSRNVVTSNGTINILNTLVLAHEIGHCLGLFHTHETAICEENIARTGQGANCSDCGDELCDTPADPNLGISTSNVNDAVCNYIGNQTQNGTPFTPDTRNIMSYTIPSCMLNFTSGQGQRMRNFILNTNNFDPYIIPYNVIIGGIGGVISNNDVYYSVQNNLESPNMTSLFNVEINGNNIVFEAGNSVTLYPGFSTGTTSLFEARIQQYSCLLPLITNSSKNESELDTNMNITSSFKHKVEDTYTPLSIEPSNNWLKVYPTVLPSSNHLIIEVNDKLDGIEIQIFDLQGKQMKLFKLNSNITSIPLDVQQGFYIIKARKGNDLFTQKIVIQ